mmetsp:Transcript_7861/g.28509  ORF Transcript_7861/g.28509 Transcript_7861/m.28509 type:complete len:702 (+) Transcript_7861:657-2762(+)
MSFACTVAVPPSPNWYSSQVSDVSSDGSLFAFAAHSYVVVLCASTGSRLRQLAAHKSRVTCVCFLVTGRSQARHLLASGSADKNVVVWDAASGRPIASLSGHRSEVVAISPFPDSRIHHHRDGQGGGDGVGDFVSVDKSGWAFGWDACRRAKPVAKLRLCENFQGALCTLLLPTSATLLGRGGAEAAARTCLCFADADGTVSVVEAGTGEALWSWRAALGPICELRSAELGGCCAIAATTKAGHAIVSVAAPVGGEGGTLGPFQPALELSPEKLLAPGERSRSWASCLLRRGGGSILVTGIKGQVMEWSPGGGCRVFCHPHNRPIFRLHELEGGGVLSCGMDRRASFVDTAGSTVWSLRGLGAHAQALACSETSGKVAVGCGDSTIRVYDPLTASGRGGAAAESSFLWSGLQRLKFSWVSFHPTREDVVLFVAEDGDRVGLVSLELERVAYASPLKMGVSSARIRPGREEGGPAALYTTQGGELRVWHHDTRHWGEMSASKVHRKSGVAGMGDGNKIRTFCFSRSGRLLVVAAESGGIHVCEKADEGSPDHDWVVVASSVVAEDTAKVACLCAGLECPGSGGSLEVFTGREDGEVAMERFHLSGGGRRGVRRSPESSAHGSRITSITWDPLTGHLATSARGDPDARIWRLRGEGEAEELVSLALEGHSAAVLSVCWDWAEPNCLHTASEDQSLRTWRYRGL